MFLFHYILLKPLPKAELYGSYHSLVSALFYCCCLGTGSQAAQDGLQLTLYSRPSELQPLTLPRQVLIMTASLLCPCVCHLPHHHPRFVLLTPTPTLHHLLNSYLFTKRLKGSKSPTEDISCFHCCRLFFEIVSHFVVLVMRTFLFGQKDYKMPLVLEWDSLSHLTN